jgi:hypothetical protein
MCSAFQTGLRVLLAINKVATSLNAGLKITPTQAFSTAEVWQVTGTNGGAGGCTASVRKADLHCR